MQRYFIEHDLSNFQSAPIWLTAETFHHIVRVMRMQVGDAIYLVDRQQRVFLAKLTQINDQKVEVSFEKMITQTSELPIDVTICVGLSKGDKLELIVQKATELGVSRIVPLQMERNIVKWKEDKLQAKLARLQKIAQEAAEQSHREVVPTITELHTLKSITPLVQQASVCLVAFEEEAKTGEHTAFSQALTSLSAGDQLILFFGPEGGITQKERNQLVSYGVVPCALGPRILRAETAPLYALSAISYQVELLNNKEF